jgi:hypothetical protein
MRTGLLALLVCTVSAAASAQSNTIAGLDAEMNRIGNLTTKGRKGTFPHGTSGVSFDTNICNTGSVAIEWKVAMDPRHPIIAFMLARELNGRLEQISDRSDVKHTFFATNASDCSFCTDASDPTVLAIGCSDTYGNDENGDRYWLAPAAEIDPWLVAWDPVCSHFDQGEPPVAPPDDCDGVRSLTQNMVNNMGPVKHRMEVKDGDLDDTAAYWVHGMYYVAGEADDLREDNALTRKFTPSWNGSDWNFAVSGTPTPGTILNVWTGANIRSNSNGGDDGRVFVASKVTGPDTNGNWHYEFAAHNRDNARGIAAFTVPICPGATITKVGFSDVDKDTTNQWTFTAGTAEVTWSTTDNPLEWNTVYNFWFDADMAPAIDSRALLTEFRTGDGIDAFDVKTEAPLGPPVGVFAGAGTIGGNGLVPDLTICGGLDVGETSELMVRYGPDSAGVFLFISDDNTGIDFHGGTIVPYPPDVIVPTFLDSTGHLLCPIDGIGGSFDVFVQAVVLDPGGEGGISMTNAVEVKL